MPESEVIEFARTQLTLPDKLNPADEMSWQHYLYSKLGKDQTSEEIVEKPVPGATEKQKTKEQIIQETAERIVAMSKVLYGLHIVSRSFSTFFFIHLHWRLKFNTHFFFWLAPVKVRNFIRGWNFIKLTFQPLHVDYGFSYSQMRRWEKWQRWKKHWSVTLNKIPKSGMWISEYAKVNDETMYMGRS